MYVEQIAHFNLLHSSWIFISIHYMLYFSFFECIFCDPHPIEVAGQIWECDNLGIESSQSDGRRQKRNDLGPLSC